MVHVAKVFRRHRSWSGDTRRVEHGARPGVAERGRARAKRSAPGADGEVDSAGWRCWITGARVVDGRGACRLHTRFERVARDGGGVGPRPGSEVNGRARTGEVDVGRVRDVEHNLPSEPVVAMNTTEQEPTSSEAPNVHALPICPEPVAMLHEAVPVGADVVPDAVSVAETVHVTGR